jgi:hypothetical protein
MYSSKPHVATEKTQQEITSRLEGLDFFLDGFDTCFRLCIEQGDRDCFRFCMQRLFVSIDTLYLIMLPDLLAAASQKEASPHMSCQVWTRLRDLKRLIEHIEPLCRLLNSLAMTMLEALDLHTDQVSDNTLAWKPETPLDHAHTDSLRKNEHSQLSCKGAKERAFTALTECLNDWRQCHNRGLSFTAQFARGGSLAPALARTDDALNTLLDYAGPLFGEVLPEFYTVIGQRGPREHIATLLLDMMQKIDLMLVQTCILFDTLYSLLQ